MAETALVILARAPVPGRAKRRLAADLGEEAAHRIYCDLLAITAREARDWPGPVCVLVDGADSLPAALGFGGIPVSAQPGGSLGERLQAALMAGLAAAGRAIVIGSDCPGLTAAALSAVDRLLDGHDAAFGPTRDGGFWAVGAKSPEAAAAVADPAIPWSSPETLRRCVEALRARGVAAASGPELDDVDTAADLERARERGEFPPRDHDPSRVAVIIPVLNEVQALPKVLAAIPRNWAARVIVVDNGSSDGSGDAARALGAEVVDEPERGYGAACLRGIAAAVPADFIVFLDGDYSDYPGEMPLLLHPVLSDAADLAIGSRMVLPESRAALLPQARFGNFLASRLLRLFFGIRCTDLGPFRCIRAGALAGLGMADRNYGWTVEMQVRAKLANLRTVEIPVRYRSRIGKSKITGTLSGSLRAGWKIVKTILVLRVSSRKGRKER